MTTQLAGLNLEIVAATKKTAISTITPDFFIGTGIVNENIKII